MKIEKIYSKNGKDLLHLVLREITSPETQERTNIVEEDQFIQLAVLNMKQGTTFKPHKHVYKNLNVPSIAQESWIVLNGSVKVFFYDLDDTIVAERVLNMHDCSITLKGGHNYLILEDNTYVMEYKTGPYMGQKLDKKFI